MISPRIVLTALLLLTSSNSLAQSTRAAESGPPAGFRALGPAPADDVISLRFALPQNDFTGLEKALYQASTPGSEKYGKYLTKDQVNAFIAPSANALSSVQSWLKSKDLTSSPVSPSGDWITANLTVSQANTLLGANYTSFQFESGSQSGKKIVRTMTYTIPKEVEGSVAGVYPGVTFPPILASDPKTLGLTNLTITDRKTRHTRSSFQALATNATIDNPGLPESCTVDPDDDSNANWEKPYTAACRFDLYGISNTSVVTQEENTMWVSGFDNESANKNMTKVYLRNNRPDLNADAMYFDLVSVDGGFNNQLPIGPSIFTTGNMWVVTSTAGNVPLTFMSVGTDTTDDPMVWFLDQANYLLALEDDELPKVLVGSSFSLRESVIDAEMAAQVCNAYAQLAARGVTLINGVSIGGVGIVFDDGSGSCKKFDVSFPASCPFVTSVGATSVETGSELSLDGFGSNNGGFSTLFARPAYQDPAVKPYLDGLGGGYEGMYDASGRAIPDVSALEFVIPTPGGGFTFGTTGFSASLVASMVSLINDERIKKGMGPMGWLNPWLYENRDAFYDIVQGTNPGCGTAGFNATNGWDPVTGVGAPRFAKMKAAAGL